MLDLFGASSTTKSSVLDLFAGSGALGIEALEAQLPDELAHEGGDGLAEIDPDVADLIGRELARQRDQIELIASENFTWPSIFEAVGSVATNKYAEGYPGRRYYGGCEYVDIAEQLARLDRGASSSAVARTAARSSGSRQSRRPSRIAARTASTPPVLAIAWRKNFGVANSMSVSAAQLTFWIYAALMGVSFASLGLVYTHDSIARVFLTTAITFGASDLAPCRRFFSDWGLTLVSDSAQELVRLAKQNDILLDALKVTKEQSLAKEAEVLAKGLDPDTLRAVTREQERERAEHAHEERREHECAQDIHAAGAARRSPS